MTVADVLRGTARLVAAGWCQGVYEREVDGQLCYCPLGAMECVLAGGYVREGLTLPQLSLMARTAWVNYLIRTYGPGTTAVGYNDDPERTQGEVVAALLAAADQADEREARRG